jgi:hypothetical protein
MNYILAIINLPRFHLPPITSHSNKYTLLYTGKLVEKSV